MEAYPPYFVGHNIPLVTLSGLGTPDPNAFDEVERQYAILQDGGQRINSELPDVTGPKAEGLLDCFQEFDARDAAWNSRPGRGKMGSMGFTYRILGRSFTLPPRKAEWPSRLEASEVSDGSQRSSVLLHSPISPLSPSSPTYPDGIMTPLWFVKHQLLLPAALIVFFNFTSDVNRNILEDNKLKNEINTLKSKLTNSGYKTRLGIVLVSETDDVDPGSAERVANLRRATSLDAKSLFHLPGFNTMAELRAFVGTILAALQPACIEYYRDLSKHARRKRSRGSTPLPTVTPTAGTSQTLSAQGWTVRYETKLGSFAEFRQEMDAAGRSYETAYESLLDGEIFESLPNQGSRFNDHRLLADVLAIRIIRCLLWTGQTSSAVQSWTNHKIRIRDLVDRNGKGTEQYGWQAWEARWSSVMGQIIDRVNLPLFHPPQEVRSPGTNVPEVPVVLAPAEKSFGNDPRLAPWDYLHHPGYWFAQSAQSLRARRLLAKGIQSEHHASLQRSPASGLATHVHQYDTFLCPGPAEEASTDHSTLLVDTLTQAAEQFSAHEGLRCTEKAYLEIALEHVGAERWRDAIEVLRPLWQSLSWRSSGWWDLVFHASSAMRKCAIELEDWEAYLAAEYELLSNCESQIVSMDNLAYFQGLPYIEEATYDFPNSLAHHRPSPKPYAKLDGINLAPTFTATFTFSKQRGNAGVPEPAQLILTSCAHENSTPIRITSIEVTFDGGLKEVEIRHVEQPPVVAKPQQNVQYYDIDPYMANNPSESVMSSSKTFSSKAADLLFKPGSSKILLLKLLPRDAGEVRALSVLLKIREKEFDFDIRISLRERDPAPPWWIPTAGTLTRQKLDLDQYCSLTVLPKPPKLRISLLRFPRTFYIDEKAEVCIHLQNEESDAADIKISALLAGGRDTIPELHSDGSEALSTTALSSSEWKSAIGEMSPGAMLERSVFFLAIPGTAELNLVIRADYFLVSDPETPITVQLKEKVHITAPFEVTYEFVPRIHANPWPSYFVLDDSDSPQNRLSQLWYATAQITSFAVETLGIREILLETTDIKFAVDCTIETAENNLADKQVEPAQVTKRSFHIRAQKGDLEDRRTGLIGLQLRVKWYRPEDPSKLTTTTLLVPALSVPFGEPRALCKAHLVPGDPLLANVTYRLENPSSHLLNFSVTMETSDEFAFSGPKAQLIQLVPLGRTDVKYTLIPFRSRTWIHPYLRITDTGFGQEVKILASEGCRNEKKAIAIWVEGDSDDSADD